ncbi:MAG: ATP-binding cassette domain-containing protein [Bacteroidales bacterium]|nr:ATP-binding cassette domain-containing protein [Candidatus Liminaster caballi]
MYLEIKDVCKAYGSYTALDHVSLSVPDGSIYGLLGPNGAGKTSLIRIINRITHADSGEVLMHGKPMTDADIRNIGYMPEERGLYKKMKVSDHILYLAQLRGMSKADARREMDEWLDRFNLGEWRDKKIEQLSKGMAQKVQFICTVIHRPPLLIFDEPFSGFDPLNADQLKREILRLRDKGAAILFSTHNMSSVEEVCQEITLINKSRVVLQGTVGDVRQMFKKNVLEVTTADGQSFNYSLQPGETMHDAISRLNNEYELTGFKEILPSMHEVFVECVK